MATSQPIENQQHSSEVFKLHTAPIGQVGYSADWGNGGHGGVAHASRAAAQESPALTTAGLPALMPRRYSVRLESFYHAVKNEPHAHRGDEKTDDPGRGVYPLGADPAHHFLGIGETATLSASRKSAY